MTSITTDADYRAALARIERYLIKYSAQLTDNELVDLRQLSLLVEQYEDIHYPMPVNDANHAS
jgi:antitoxin component HigA of HigAB toxin-antitoxin module